MIRNLPSGISTEPDKGRMAASSDVEDVISARWYRSSASSAEK